MNGQHTPGPWACHEQGVPNHYAFILDKGKWLCAIQFNGEHLVETQNADARLIAAAPDLLKALQQLCADELHTQEKWDNARDAIAKATGGA